MGTGQVRRRAWATRATLATLATLVTLGSTAAITVGTTVPAYAAGGAVGTATADPATQTLAALKAQADAAQVKLAAGAQRLDASRAALVAISAQAAAAKAAVAQVSAGLAGLRGDLAGYAADLYVHPTNPAEAVALTEGSDLSVSIQGVQMLTIVDSGRSNVLREMVVADQQSEELQSQADQAAAAAAAATASISAQVAALQAESAQVASRLGGAQLAYQAALERAAAAAAAAAKLVRDRTARALAEKRAAAAAAAAADVVVPSADCTADGSYPSGPWGGYSDGFVPASQLCAITGGGRLRPDAALAFDRMSVAYAQTFGSPLCVSDSYRSYTQQVAVFRQRPSLAAVPGTSNHGWGLAVDLGCGVQRYGSAQYRWMTANAGRFGWVHPQWALHDPFEPWHWEFGHLSGAGGT